MNLSTVQYSTVALCMEFDTVQTSPYRCRTDCGKTLWYSKSKWEVWLFAAFVDGIMLLSLSRFDTVPRCIALTSSAFGRARDCTVVVNMNT